MVGKTCTHEQMEAAETLAKAIFSIPKDKRSIYQLVMDAMLIGGELVERTLPKLDI